MIYATIPAKYIISNDIMLFIDIIAGIEVVKEWRDKLLEELETPENDNHAVTLGKEINDATIFLSQSSITTDVITDSMEEEDPYFNGKMLKMLVNDAHIIKKNEWHKYLENAECFLGALIQRYNKIVIQLSQKYNLEMNYTMTNGTLKSEDIF